MDNRIKNRFEEKIYYVKESHLTAFLYKTYLGRLILKLINSLWLSKIIGKFLCTKISKCLINPFIKKNKVNMEDYEIINYYSFNDFFSRNIKDNKREIGKYFISPCDAKLRVYNINKDLLFKVKNSEYKIEDLLEDKSIAKKYNDGYALVFRLAVEDYHRYCYVDNGNQEYNRYIKGILHAVRPVALYQYPVFIQNSREWTILHTINYGDIIQMEIGALMVGKIVNLHSNYNFKKGEEKGYFQFGGSTIILLVQKDKVIIEQDILDNSINNIETIVKYGENIGKKFN